MSYLTLRSPLVAPPFHILSDGRSTSRMDCSEFERWTDEQGRGASGTHPTLSERLGTVSCVISKQIRPEVLGDESHGTRVIPELLARTPFRGIYGAFACPKVRMPHDGQDAASTAG